MIVLKGIQEYQKQLGNYIKSLRLDEGRHTQKSKAAQCGIPFPTYIKFENSGKGSVKMLLKVLASYNLLTKIDELTKIIELSPSQKIANSNKAKKQRVKHSTKGSRDG